MTMALTQVSDNGLTNTGVTAATYGSSSAIPSLTIDAKGRVTAASTTSIDSTSISNGTSSVSVANNSNIDFVRGGTTQAVVTDAGIKFGDGRKALFGDANDLQIYHDGTDGLIENNAEALVIRNHADDRDIYLQADNGSGGTTNYIKCDGSTGDVVLFQYGNQKLQTFASGVDITGELQCDSLDVDGAADISGSLDVGGELNLIGTGDGAKYIDARVGSGGTLSIRGTLGGDANHSNLATFTRNGAVNLYNAGQSKLSTKSDGVNVTGELECDSLDVDGNSHFSGGDIDIVGANYNAVWDHSESKLKFNDNAKLAFGTSSDLQIFHSGNHSYIETTTSSVGDLFVVSQGSGHDLYLQAADDIFIRPANGENGIVVSSDGAVELYHNNSLRFQTDATATTMRGGGQHRCEGHFRPWSNNTYDLGTSGDRWRNVYTNDLHLSNEGSANDIDGTWGNFTIQEGEDDLFLINRRNGKKYKFNLTEVS